MAPQQQQKHEVASGGIGTVAKVLAPLDASALSATYGRGFAMIRRMGFKAGSGLGLREGALVAPLLAHDQGRSRRGVQSQDEQPEMQEGMEAVLANARGSGRPTDQLLAEVLATMREAGDADAATELLRLAACVGIGGSSSSFENLDDALGFSTRNPAASAAVQHRWKRRGHSGRAVVPGLDAGSDDEDEEDEGSSEAQERRSRPGEDRAVAVVLNRLNSDAAFPIVLEEQARELLWRRRYEEQLGDYEDFIERRSDAFRLVRCPGAEALVLPAPGRGGAGGGAIAGKYSSWCQRQRSGAGAKAKKKWKHIEKVVSRLCAAAGEEHHQDAHAPASAPTDTDRGGGGGEGGGVEGGGEGGGGPAGARAAQPRKEEEEEQEAGLSSDGEGLAWAEDVEGDASVAAF